MSRALLAESLRDFAPDSWWAVFDALVDGDAQASPSELERRVHERTRPGDLKRAAASYGTSEDHDEGARLLTDRIVTTLLHQQVIEQTPAGDWRVTDAYLRLHRTDNGGIRFAVNVDGNWSTYTADPAPIREARRQASSERLNTSAAVLAAAKYRRPVLTAEERSAKKSLDAREAADELYLSLLEHGYLDAFPITVNRHGQVVSGNHRLRFAALASDELQRQLESERANGSDPVAVADLERRIASLDQRRIRTSAVVVDSAADEVRVTTASEIQIPWAEHEKKALAKKLTVDGWSVREIAARLRERERQVREWTEDERTDLKATQQAEALRLTEAGWTQVEIGKHLGVNDKTVGNWLRNFGESGESPKRVSRRRTALSVADLAPLADRFLAENGGTLKAFEKFIREQMGRGVMSVTAGTALREAKERERRLGAPALPVVQSGQPVKGEVGTTEPPAVCSECGRVLEVQR